MPTQVEQRHRDAVEARVRGRVDMDGWLPGKAYETVIAYSKEEACRSRALLEQLLEYVRHPDHCAIHFWKPDDQCNCGLRALLSEIEEETR